MTVIFFDFLIFFPFVLASVYFFLFNSSTTGYEPKEELMQAETKYRTVADFTYD